MIAISDGKRADVSVLDELILEPGAFYVMDRGYVDFARLYRFVLAGAFFVTRAKAGCKSTVWSRARWIEARRAQRPSRLVEADQEHRTLPRPLPPG
jgi:hypothetical protein